MVHNPARSNREGGTAERAARTRWLREDGLSIEDLDDATLSRYTALRGEVETLFRSVERRGAANGDEIASAVRAARRNR